VALFRCFSGDGDESKVAKPCRDGGGVVRPAPDGAVVGLKATYQVSSERGNVEMNVVKE
jgi:hypothetical protein